MADTQVKLGTSAASVDSGQYNDPAWSNPGNATSENGSCASVSLNPSPYDDSDYLRVTGYSFALPTGAEVLGVAVRIKGYVSSSGSGRYTAKILKAGSPAGTSKTWDFGGEVGTTNSWTAAKGGDGDLWGTTLSKSDVEASNFGVQVEAYYSGTSGKTCYVDCVEVTVYYQTPTVEVGATVAGGAAPSGDLDVIYEEGADELAATVTGGVLVGGDLTVPEYLPLTATVSSAARVSSDAVDFPTVDGTTEATFALAVTVTVQDVETLTATVNAAGDPATGSYLDVPALPSWANTRIYIAFTEHAESEPEWVEITERVRHISVRRGRQTDLDRTEAGTCTLTVANPDRALEPAFDGSPYYPNVTPGRPLLVTAEYMGVTYPRFRGEVEEFPISWTVGGDATVELTAVDGFAALAAADIAGGYPNEETGARIDRVLTEAEWPPQRRSLDPGQSFVQEKPAIEDGEDKPTALDHVHEIEESEQGVAFVAAGGDFVFLDRSTRSTPPSPVAVFGDDPDATDELPYTDMPMDYSLQRVYTEVAVTRENGREQRATDTDAARQYGRRILTVGNLLTADVVCAQMADYLLERFRQPRVRFTGLAVDPRADTRIWPTLLNLEIGDVVRCRRRPPGPAGLIEQDCYVESISEDVTLHQVWRTTLTLSAAFTSTVTVDADGIDPPINEALPDVRGTPAVGETLAATAGEWYGSPDITHGYQWVRIDTGAVETDIAGATAASYAVQPADVDRTLKVRVRATNPAGYADADSEPTDTVVLQASDYTGGDGGGGDGGSDPEAHTAIWNVDVFDDPLALMA